MKTVAAMKWLCACLAALFLTAFVHAQQQPKLGARKAWFALTFDVPEEHNPASILVGSDVVEVILNQRQVGRPIQIPKDGMIRFIEQGEVDPATNKPKITVLGKAVIPEKIRNALVILSPTPEKEAPLIYRTSVQDLGRFQGGNIMYLNLTNTKVAVTIGDERLIVDPARRQIHVPPKRNAPFAAPVSYHFQDPADKRWKLLSASTIAVNPKRREICVFSPDPRFNRINYRGIMFPVAPAPRKPDGAIRQ